MKSGSSLFVQEVVYFIQMGLQGRQSLVDKGLQLTVFDILGFGLEFIDIFLVVFLHLFQKGLIKVVAGGLLFQILERFGRFRGDYRRNINTFALGDAAQLVFSHWR